MKAVYDGVDKRLKLFLDSGSLLFTCEARNDSIAPNAWRPDAGCPPGTYQLQVPFENVPPTAPEGRWFCELTGVSGHDGIGIHGGGSCSTQPFDPEQGWCPTLNCIRLQNMDLESFVQLYRPVAPIAIEVVQPAA